jgi:hypothetical protein
MADETNTGKTEVAPPSRRTVITTAAQVAVTAPAVALLLNATSKSAFAQVSAYDSPGETADGVVARGDDNADDIIPGTFVDDAP